jgi:hypothetical protein
MKINYVTVIAATLIHFIIGGVWYGRTFWQQIYSADRVEP